MRLLLTIIVFLSFSFKPSTVVFVKNIDSTGNYITTDKIGNIYMVNHNQLYKFGTNYNLQYTYSNKSAGDITSVDASDPLKILLFYKDLGQIIFLDNTLSIKGDVLSLENLALEQSILACSSYESGFWIYEPQSSQLIRINNRFQISNKSDNINQLTDKEINPSYLIEVNNAVYMNNPETGILLFDKYGTYNKTLPFKGLKTFQIIDDKLIYMQDSFIKSYNFKTFEETAMELPETKPLNIRVEQNNLYILNDKGINIYNIK